MMEQKPNRQLIIALLCALVLFTTCIFYATNWRPDTDTDTGSFPAGRNDASSSEHPLLGVNVYGWIRGDFGGGRTARSVINNLHSVGVALTAIEISGADLHSTTNMAIEEQGFVLFPRKDFAFDLFVINAANTLTTLTDPDNDISQDHYRIGLWHWETSKLPLLQGSYGQYYNEIWVPTQFVADAILATESFPAADVKVVVLPYGYESLPPPASAVSTGPGQRQQQQHGPRRQLPRILRQIVWQTREESVLMSAHAEKSLQYWADTDASDTALSLFLVIFDFNSDYNRKNIIATVRAFLKAFPSDTRGSIQNSTAGLLIKSINAHNQIADFHRLLWVLQGGGRQEEGVSLDERVVLLNGLCSEPDLQQLKQAASCYVSLHRAEGLGLNLMEAALSGVPVIASAYSGSEQFMRPLYGQLAPELRIPTTTVQVPAVSHLLSHHLSLSLSLSTYKYTCCVS
jgi:glycosyltransferase involved in cell wall biosynthesis